MTSRYVRTAALAVPLTVLTALSFLLIAGEFEAAAPGLPDPGAVVRVGLPMARAMQDMAAAATVGLLILAACALPPTTTHAAAVLEGSRARAMRFAALAALCWLLFGFLALVLTYSEVVGIAPNAPGFASHLGYFMRSVDLGRAMATSLVLVALVCAGSVLAARINTVGWLAVLSLGALLPLAISGHAAGSDNHQVAVDTLGIHIIGVSIWVGGLVALLLLSPWLPKTLPVSTLRYSTLAGWCFVIVAASGVVNAWLRLGSLSNLSTNYGLLVILKTGALVLLGVIGWRHRRTVLPRLNDGPSPRRDFLRLAVGEVLVMGATIGIAVALSQSALPLPQTSGDSSPDAATALLGYPLPASLTAMRWVTTWYVEPAWAALTVVAIALYLVGLHRVRRRGERWPTHRSVLWVLGCLTLLWATSGAPGVYGKTLFSAHMAQHMTLMMVVPMLLVMAAPVSLAMRTLRTRIDGSRGSYEWLLAVLDSRALTFVTNPIVAACLFIGSLFVFYSTPLLGLSLSTHTGHMMMTGHFLVVGYLFAWVVMGPDPLANKASYPTKAFILLTTVAAHAFFAIEMMTLTHVLAEGWFTSIGVRGTAELMADQHLGGWIAWALSMIPTIVMAVIVARGWSRSNWLDDETDHRLGGRRLPHGSRSSPAQALPTSGR